MGRGQKHRENDNNKNSLPQTPKNEKIEPDGQDIEFSQELADADDLEAQRRAQAVEERAKERH